MTRTTLDSVEIRELAPGEERKLSAWLGQALDGATISSVTSIEQTSGTTTLEVSSGVINSGGAVTVDGVSRATSTVVQYVVTVPEDAELGDYVLTVTYATSGGNTEKFRCRLRIV